MGRQTSVGAAAVEVAPFNASRLAVLLQNVGPANVRVGPLGVAATTGIRLTPDSTLVFEEAFVIEDAIFAVRESATDSTVLVMEVET